MSSFLGTLLSPFSQCLDCIQGPSFAAQSSYAQFKNEQKKVRLDATKMGKEVVILKEGERICGTGGAIATTSIEQNKGYFQVNIQQTGVWGVGLASAQACLDDAPVTAHFWGVRDSGDVYANGQLVAKLDKPIDEGDSIGVCYDHVEMRLLVNGEPAIPTVSNVKGPVFPCIYVDDSAILDVKFKSFSYPAPDGYGEILIEQTLL